MKNKFDLSISPIYIMQDCIVPECIWLEFSIPLYRKPYQFPAWVLQWQEISLSIN